jgi:hypothetical protein
VRGKGVYKLHRGVYTDPEPAWVFWEPHVLPRSQTEEMYIRKRFQRDAL